ncbi:NADH-quinone oxidoreductase subunit C [Streptomyces sp. NBC_01601]|uniref:NADH-quinone oxidoreductase subunit C n=1 Tax=Streptomyces sp. NBC_01601 TaxID=2975892 RepID=UPI002E2AE97A|nr:NADH-quinone oxidoreductase subunit C [Streptomyces sp. NBC_01601]
MSTGWLPAPAEELFGPEATAEESYDVLTVDVPPAAWLTALETARTTLSCTYFDWLSAVDEPGTGFKVSAHVVALHPVRRLLVRTTVPHEAPVLPSAVGVYAGAAWHERETHEMFGVDFTGHPALDHLLLPENFEGHPLRKDFVLAARVAKAWPGAKEPGESEHGGPKRRQMLPPGVPDPNEWGPLKGQLPPAPARPARGAAGERPARRSRTAAEGSGAPAAAETEAARPRRARSASEGSASQAAPEPGAAPGRRMRSAGEGPASQAAPEPGPGAAPPRRTRSASQGSASQAAPEGAEAPAGTPTETPTETPTGTPAEAPKGPRRSRSASQGSASQRTEAPEAAEPSASSAPAEPSTPSEPSEPGGSTEPGEPTKPEPAEHRAAPRSADAPWHHARPAFEEPDESPTPSPGPERKPTENPEKSENPDHPTGGSQ